MKARPTNGWTDNGTLFLACEPEIRIRVSGHRDYEEGYLLDAQYNDLGYRVRQLALKTLVILAQVSPPPL